MGNLRMPSMANIVISGRLTADPAMKTLPSGASVCRIRIANDQRRGNAKETLFLTCCAWGKTAEWAAANLHKGAPVLLSGALELKSWTKKDGTSGEELEVNVDTIQLLEWDDDRKPGRDADRATPTPADDTPVPDDDIPF